jgi:hypothetical protein
MSDLRTIRRASPVVVIGKEPYEVVVVTATSRISFGKYPTREARSLTAAITASPRVILKIERWLDLAGSFIWRRRRSAKNETK